MMNILKRVFILSLTLILGVTSAIAQTDKSKEKYTKNLTQSDFLRDVMDYKENPNEWNYKGDKPAIIDFHATWCGPCKKLAPILEVIAKEYKDEIYVYKIDTDEEPELANVFEIKSLPTILFVPVKGKPKTLVGLLSNEEIKKEIDTFLLNK